MASLDMIEDEFEDGAIDPDLWETRTWFMTSAVSEDGGVLNLTQRAYFLSRDDWIPQEASPLMIEFDWQFSSGVNNLTVVTRSDGESRDDRFAEIANGVAVHFSGEADNLRVILEIAGGGAEVPGGGTGPDYVPFVLSPGTTYHVRVVDTGTTVSVFVDDMNTPVLVADVDTMFTINRVVFFNRETNTGSDWIDNVAVSGLRGRN